MMYYLTDLNFFNTLTSGIFRLDSDLYQCLRLEKRTYRGVSLNGFITSTKVLDFSCTFASFAKVKNFDIFAKVKLCHCISEVLVSKTQKNYVRIRE